MKGLAEKPVAALTTDELARAYVDRLLMEGVKAVESGETATADSSFFESLRQHVHMTAAQSN